MILIKILLQKKIIIICFSSILFTFSSYGQFTTDKITYGKRIDLENNNTWAVGGGFSNFIMHGDLRSIGTMMTPIIGILVYLYM